MQKVIKVQIKDLENTVHFQIRLFDVMEGIDFLDRHLANKEKSVKNFLKDILPLATLLDTQGANPVASMTLETVGSYFQNPLSVVELGIKILEHQMVFMKESETFREYAEAVAKLFRLQISDSATPSATS